MPITLESSTGTVIHVATGAPTSYAAADLASLTWDQFAGVVSFPAWGDTATDNAEGLLAESRMYHSNDVVDGGEITITAVHLDTDDGLDALKAVKGTNDPITIMKVTRSGEGEVATGIVASVRTRAAQQGTNRGWEVIMRINSAVTELSSADVTTALA